MFLLAVVMALGNLYFQLHALPERMAHRASRVQLEIVAVLCLIALFTHNHIYWILGLLLALVQLPDFSTPVASIAESLERFIRRRRPEPDPPVSLALPSSSPAGDKEISDLELMLCSMLTVFRTISTAATSRQTDRPRNHHLHGMVSSCAGGSRPAWY